MGTYHITFIGRDGTRQTARVAAATRQGAITIARIHYGARGPVSAVAIASAKPRSFADAFPRPGQGGRVF